MASRRGVVVRGRDARSYHEPEFVDKAAREQRLGDRDAAMDTDVAARLLLEVPRECDQTAVDHIRVGHRGPAAWMSRRAS